jgi:hypothetical protein
MEARHPIPLCPLGAIIAGPFSLMSVHNTHRNKHREMVVGQRHRLSYGAAREDAVADLDRPHARVPGLAILTDLRAHDDQPPRSWGPCSRYRSASAGRATSADRPFNCTVT